jgi:hypothetical protein
MTMVLKRVPEKYRNVSLLQDVKTRDTLTKVINKILLLIKDTKHYEYDSVTRNKVIVFLDYLEQKSQTLENLTVWSKWLILYGIFISSLLQDVLIRTGCIPAVRDIEKRDLFLTNFSQMIDDVTRLGVVHPKLFSTHHESIQILLEDISDRSSSVSDTVLDQLTPDILNISNYVNDLYTLHPFQYDENISRILLNYLKMLQKKIERIDLLTLYDKFHNG